MAVGEKQGDGAAVVRVVIHRVRPPAVVGFVEKHGIVGLFHLVDGDAKLIVLTERGIAGSAGGFVKPGVDEIGPEAPAR